MHITHTDIIDITTMIRLNSTLESWQDSAYQITTRLMSNMLADKYGNRNNESELYLTPYQIQYITVQAMFDISKIPRAVAGTSEYEEFIDVFTTFIGTYIKITLLALPDLTALDLDYTPFKSLFTE